MVRSYVRMALHNHCKVYGIKNSFEGLLAGDVQVGFSIMFVFLSFLMHFFHPDRRSMLF